MIHRAPGAACLGMRVSGLADGSLADDVRDRALVHVASCGGCREALDVERLLVQRLRELPTPAPSAALVARLLAFADPGEPLPPRSGRVAGTPRQPSAVLVGLPPGGRPTSTTRPAGSTRPSGRRENRRSARALVVAAAAAGVLGVGVMAVTAIGAALPSNAPKVVPPVDQLTVQRSTEGADPFSNAGLVRSVPSGPFVRPTAVPALRRVDSGR